MRLHSLVEGHNQQITEVLPEIERHLLASPVEHSLQGYNGKETYCGKSTAIPVTPPKMPTHGRR